MPALISDLALILIVAGLVTLVFKRLKQPLVLGYIVAGFLAGPHMPYTPTVADVGSIDTWSEIGVIFLMFTLGLEFSFKKIVKMGARPVLAACSVMFCMMGLGSGVGHLLGWGSMNSLFLGGMLAMSSTTIIYKAFDDLGLRHRKFAGEVLSVLILEDILGILLMVVLSMMAASRELEGDRLLAGMFQLGFFLLLWFLVGVYLVPVFLKRWSRWMNAETLLVVSIGLCFGLVVIADRAGYSSAFGAFMMGSILAETVEAEQIERTVRPVKDLFGAVFFVSVGMLVDPAVLVAYWPAILILTLTILLGQAVLGTGCFLLSGQPLQVAVQCGFSLAQIGEFAFIIASLGLSLGVTDAYLYPVVVAVSIVTTFLTPYMIRAAEPAYGWVQRRLPDRWVQAFDSHAVAGHRHRRGPLPAGSQAEAWRSLASALLKQTASYLTLSSSVILLSLGMLLPLCRRLLGHYPGNALCGLLAVACASPFLRALVMRKNHSRESKTIASAGRCGRWALRLLTVLRFVVAMAAVYYVLSLLSPLRWYWHWLLSALLMGLVVASRVVKFASIRMERTFVQNLRSRQLQAVRSERSGPTYAHRLQSRDVHIARLQLPSATAWAGRRLSELGFSHRLGVMVAAILREGRRINIPGGDVCVCPGDTLEVIGDDGGIEAFSRLMQSELLAEAVPATADHRLRLRRLVVGAQSLLAGKPLSKSGLRSHYRCMAVGFESTDGSITLATADHVISHPDILWVVGEYDAVRRLERDLCRT